MLPRRFPRFLACAALAAAVTAAAADDGSDTEDLSPSQPYSAVRSDPLEHDVEFVVIVTPPYHCQSLDVWIPVPQSDQAQEIANSQFSTFPVETAAQIGNEPIYNNRFAYFHFDHPQGAQIIRHQFQAKVWTLEWNLDAEKTTRPTRWPDRFDPYRRPQPVDDEQQLQTLLQSIVPERTEPGNELRNVMNWVDQNMTYDHVHASLSADANHALAERRGHCSDYHGLCATMGRMLGYPAQVTYGLSLFPKNSPSHCKLEAFLPPYGWVSYDVSETQKLVQKIRNDEQLSSQQKAVLTSAARNRMQSGFRENSWLLLTRGSDYQLIPKSKNPVRVVRTAWIEADGEPLPEPDPANPEQRQFAWMTAHRYTSDKPVQSPFADYTTLEE
ncbi:MAG: transglutaminase domain-containing protein [Planctomycetaceae bacterium]